MDVKKQFGQNVRRLRRAADMSQEALGLKILGADQGYVSRLESGQGNPTLVQIAMIAKALNVDVGQLFAAADS